MEQQRHQMGEAVNGPYCWCLKAFNYLGFILLVQKPMEIDTAFMLFCLYVCRTEI